MSSAEGTRDEHISDDESPENEYDYEGSESQSHSESDPEMEDSDNEHGKDNEELKNSSSDAESVSTEDEDDRLSLDENAEDGGWMDAEDEGDDSMSSSDDEQPNGINESVQPKINSNPGWADAMAKILRTTKPKGKKSIVLAKAKKLSQSSEAKKKVEKEDDPGFEIDGDVKTEDIKPKVEEMDVKPDLDKTSLRAKLKRRDHLAEGRVKPSILDRERERALSKIATKGVVQLFNAVRQQQKEINAKLAEAGGSVRREEKVMKSIDKRAFLDVLMGNTRSERVEDLVQTKKEEDVNPSKAVNAASWNVLRDDFMTGGSLKNWDKAQEIKMENEDEVLLD